MLPRLPLRLCLRPGRRAFSCSARRREVIELPHAGALPERSPPTYQATRQHDLLGLHWHSPLRTVLLMKKEEAPHVTDSLIEFAYHVQTTYPDVNLLLEPSVARAIHEHLPSPIYSLPTQNREAEKVLHDNVDLITTLGGDGTILHAAGLYANSQRVPPILAFSMGTLGFLGEWKFAEYKRAFREVYMSGASAALEQTLGTSSAAGTENTVKAAEDPWASLRGKFMGTNRHARILLRHQSNRSEGVDVSIDGMRMEEPLGRGGEVRITGEDVGLRALGKGEGGAIMGGVPSIVRGTNGGSRGEDHWVGGLNGLLKFNYPFGEEV
ncbi:putative poly atp nad kinase protein [Neofusicoccum parvum UCRNP2]|uniref:Nadh kinase pos5 n=2 Tax=Neofusicoccum parvum TaxID=310453 RepID=A0ACB5SKR6_9PEZI|nr:putative poly atp nad kinase protein [Neofusicoccum parvum UCRNP2]GME46037.1 Nadh kinase pos5 [Neofusicoccum parvum]